MATQANSPDPTQHVLPPLCVPSVEDCTRAIDGWKAAIHVAAIEWSAGDRCLAAPALAVAEYVAGDAFSLYSGDEQRAHSVLMLALCYIKLAIEDRSIETPRGRDAIFGKNRGILPKSVLAIRAS